MDYSCTTLEDHSDQEVFMNSSQFFVLQIFDFYFWVSGCGPEYYLDHSTYRKAGQTLQFIENCSSSSAVFHTLSSADCHPNDKESMYCNHRRLLYCSIIMEAVIVMPRTTKGKQANCCRHLIGPPPIHDRCPMDQYLQRLFSLCTCFCRGKAIKSELPSHG